MRDYLLFAGEWYYPHGGWGDLEEASDSFEELLEKADKIKERYAVDWYNIVDTKAMEVVFKAWNHGGGWQSE